MVAVSKPEELGEVGKEVYFMVWGADKEAPLKSDRIPVKSIVYAKATQADKMRVPMKKVKVTLSKDVNGGVPIAGQDYILRINLRQFYGMSDQDQYFKDAAIRAKKDMEAEASYAEMVKALNMCFSRELGAKKDSNPYLSFSSDSTGITIEEKEQPWTLGTEALERVFFDVVPTTVYDGVADYVWGETEEQTSTSFVGNGKNVADLEYFLLGERGDQYRKIGWPNDIETKGMVDPEKEYDIFEIHYFFSDTGVNSYKTEKDITVAIPKDTKGNDLVKAFCTATGLTMKDFSGNIPEAAKATEDVSED